MLSKRKDAVVSKEMVRSIGLAVIIALGLVLGACSQSGTPGKNDGGEKPAGKSAEAGKPVLYEAGRVNCSVFTGDDAAAILGLPAAEIQVDSEELYAGNWQCLYKGGTLEKMVSFNVSLSKSAEEASTNMDQYRGHLNIAGETSPFKDDLKKGAYSDISGVGDDALWTDVNRTLTVRKGNVSLQVQMPKDKDTQIKVAEKFLSRLESER